MQEPTQSQDEQPTTTQDDYAVWQAILDEGNGHTTVINQKDFLTDPSKPHYELLPREKLRLFRMIHPESGRVILQVPFKAGQGSRLIWRRRRQVIPGGGENWFYVVGKRGAFVNVILPDYSILSDDNFSEDNVLMNDIEPVAGEEGYKAD